VSVNKAKTQNLTSVIYLFLLKFKSYQKNYTLSVLVLLTKSVLKVAKFRKYPAGGELQTWESRNWNNADLQFQAELHVSAPRWEPSTYRPLQHHQPTLPTIRLLAANCCIMQFTPSYLLFLSSFPLDPYIHLRSRPHARAFSASLWLTSLILPPFVVIDCLATTRPHPYRRQYLLKSASRLITLS
jgi:hypothetical protein